MKFNKTTLFGAFLGLIMGLVFTVIALYQYDENVTNSRDVLFSSLFVGLPFSILIGLLIGWIWSKLFGKSIF